MNKFEAQANTIPQPVEVTQALPQPMDAIAPDPTFAQRLASRTGNLARPLMLGVALAGAGAIVASEVVSPATADAKPAWKDKYCSNGNMNTILCLGDVAAQCDQISSTTTFDIKAKYVGSSKTKYRVSGKSYDMGGCAPVGSKELTIWQESRAPGETDFTRSSNVMKLITSKKTSKFKKTLKAPYSCDDGPIETRDAVGTRFVAKKGTGIKSSKKTIRYEKTKTLCAS